MDARYWTSTVAALVREFRAAPRAVTRDMLGAGVRAQQIKLAAPDRELFDALPDTEDVTVPLGEVRFRVNNMDPFEQYALGALVTVMRPDRVFEIGTFDGATTRLVARCAPEAEIFTLDLAPEGAETATVSAETANVRAGLVGSAFHGSPEAARITQLHGDSRVFDFSAWYGLIDLVIVDGGHEADVALSDTQTAQRLLRPGGVIVWDDYMPYWPGVVTAVDSSGLAVFRLLRTDLAIHVSSAGPPAGVDRSSGGQ